MAATIKDAEYTMAQIQGYRGTREQWDAHQLRRAERERADRIQRRAAGFRKAVRARGARPGSMRRERPAWQRGDAPTAHSRIMHALQDPRVRGQLATRP